MSGAPKASVVIAAYNVGEFLREAIDSVLAQSLTDFELIVVDDGSSDDTLRIAEAAASDDRVRVISHGTNRGAPAARNTGMNAARGEFVAFLDGDDMLHPAMLASMITAATDHDVDIVTCGWSTFAGDGEPTPAPFRFPLGRRLAGADLDRVLERAHRDRLYWFNTTFVYRRDHLTRAGLQYATDVVMVDTLFSAQALRAARSLFAVPRHLYIVRQRPGSTTRLGNPAWNANIGDQYRALRSFYESSGLWPGVATDYYGYVLQFSVPQAISNACVIAEDRRELRALLADLTAHDWVQDALDHGPAWRGLNLKRRVVASLLRRRWLGVATALYARQLVR